MSGWSGWSCVRTPVHVRGFLIRSLIYPPSHSQVFERRVMSEIRRPKVLITRSDVPKEAVGILREKCEVEIYPGTGPMKREELFEQARGKDALFCLLTDKITKEFLDAAGPRLRVIGTMSVGFDHIDLKECKKRGIQVGHTPGLLTDAVSELTVSLLLATARRLIEASKEVTNGGWMKCAWSPLYMCGATLSGSTVGIVGLGRIGHAVAERLKPFKVKSIVYCGNMPKEHAAENLGAKFVSFEELLGVSDFVVCCCSLNDTTAGLFNKAAFEKMKNTAVFINTSRGGVVNQEDLYVALTSGKIRAAGLDVTDPEPLPTDHKLAALSNCVILPHIGSATVETRIAMAVLTSNNILAGLDGKPLPCPL